MKLEKNQMYWADLSPARGSEMGGIRKVKIKEVLSDDLITIIPYALDVPITNQTRTICTERLKEKI